MLDMGFWIKEGMLAAAHGSLQTSVIFRFDHAAPK